MFAVLTKPGTCHFGAGSTQLKPTYQSVRVNLYVTFVRHCCVAISFILSKSLTLLAKVLVGFSKRCFFSNNSAMSTKMARRWFFPFSTFWSRRTQFPPYERRVLLARE